MSISNKIKNDTGWVTTYSNRQGTTKDFKRTLELSDDPTQDEVNEVLATCVGQQRRHYVKANDGLHCFYGTYDTSD